MSKVLSVTRTFKISLYVQLEKSNDNKIYGSIRYQYKISLSSPSKIFEKNLRVDNDSTWRIRIRWRATEQKFESRLHETRSSYHPIRRLLFIERLSIYLNISTSSSSSSMDGIMFWTFPQFSNLLTRVWRERRVSSSILTDAGALIFFFRFFFFSYLFIYFFVFTTLRLLVVDANNSVQECKRRSIDSDSGSGNVL